MLSQKYVFDYLTLSALSALTDLASDHSVPVNDILECTLTGAIFTKSYPLSYLRISQSSNRPKERASREEDPERACIFFLRCQV